MPAPPSPRLRFPRASRLKLGRDFVRLRGDGRRLAAGCLVANWMGRPPASTPRLGVVVSSRVGNAVVRSRTRRLLREVYRLHQRDFGAPMDLVLVARPSIAGKQFREVENDFLNAMHRAGLFKRRPLPSTASV